MQFTDFQGSNVFASCKLTNFVQKEDFQIDELLEQEDLISDIKLSLKTLSN